MDNKSIAHTKWNCTYRIHFQISQESILRANEERFG